MQDEDPIPAMMPVGSPPYGPATLNALVSTVIERILGQVPGDIDGPNRDRMEYRQPWITRPKGDW